MGGELSTVFVLDTHKKIHICMELRLNKLIALLLLRIVIVFASFVFLLGREFIKAVSNFHAKTC
jgi:hypothetical protein